MIDHLSVSQMNLYQLCSLKYRFQYLDELPKPFRPAALAFGSAFHAALAWFHDHVAEGNGTTLDKLIKIFAADWYAQRTDTEILYNPGETEAKLFALAKQMLGLYFAKPQQKIRKCEVHFNVPLENPVTGDKLGITLEGFFDLVLGDDTIVEFKTSGQTMTQRDAEGHLQLTAYSYAYEILHERPAKLLRIVDFVKTKSPKMIALDTSRTPRDHSRFFNLAQEVLHGIRACVFFPKAGYWCRDCEYAGPCRKWNGN